MTFTEVMRKQSDGSSKAVSCPRAVKLYNENMGGVDLHDQKRNMYSCTRRSRKWWYRLFYFMLDVAVGHAHILESESPNHECRPLKDFILELGKQLVSLHSSRKRKSSFSFGSSPQSGHAGPGHYSQKFDTSRECVVCKRVGKKRKQTKYGCDTCRDSSHKIGSLFVRYLV